jgi:hypothetical protein
VTKVQRFTPIGVLAIMLLAVGWSLLPFDFTDEVRCGAPLLGGKPNNTTQVGLIRPEEDCKSKAKSRLLTSALISLAAAGAGTAAIALKPLSTQCLNGDHDDCPDWWSNLLTYGGGLGCQCPCHTEAGI